MRTFTEADSLQHAPSKDAYIFSIVPIPIGAASGNSIGYRFAYIASDDSLNIISLTSTQSIKPVTNIPRSHEGVSCLGAFRAEAGLLTAGRDGKVKYWSANMSDHERWQVGMELSTPNSQGISALAFDEDQKLIAAGTESEKEGLGDVAVYIWSYADQSSPQLLRSYTESHTDTITSLHFQHTPLSSSPTSAQLLTLISTSTDSLISIFDPAQEDEDDALTTVFNNKAAVSHVCPFLIQSPVIGNPMPALCAISHDERLSVYEVEDAAKGEGETENEEDLPPVWPELDLRQALNADYAISLLPRRANQQPSGMTLAVGAYRPETIARVSGAEGPIVALYSGAPRLLEGKIEGFECEARLKGAHGEDVVRDVYFDEQMSFILTCGEDGVVRLWVDRAIPIPKTGVDIEMEGTSEDKTSGAKRDREERKKKRKAERHKPY